MKKILVILLSLCMLLNLSACSSDSSTDNYEDAYHITLNGDSAQIDGVDITETDYTWNVDPSINHDEVKNQPAEYYTGTKYEGEDIVYIDHELYYFPELNEEDFTLVNYDGEREWAYYYQDGVNDEFIFATLPNFNNKVPTDMMHSQEEASENKVLHITKEGTYVLSGNWNGQINVDLGEEAFSDETKKITIVLNGVEIKCSVAPGVIFTSAYEVDNTWEENETNSNDKDTSEAGVSVIVADGSTNSVDGQNVFRMLKTKYKDEESTDAIKLQKKARKTDAAFYSYVTMNIKGEDKNDGTLTVTSNFEGLDSELHLNIYGPNITINSGDDGINVNEDNVSIVSLLGGTITLNAAQGEEGDGIDSNGYVIIDGATLCVNNVTAPDNAVDSEDGIEYKSGSIIIDNEESGYEFGSYKEINGTNQGMGGGNFNPGEMNKEFELDIDVKELKEKIAALSDDATYEDVMEILGLNNMGGGAMPDMPTDGGNMEQREMPEGDKDMPQGDFKPDENMKNDVMSIEDFDIKEIKEKVAALSDDATTEEILEIFGLNNMGGGFNPGDGQTPPEKPDNQNFDLNNENMQAR